MLDADEADVSVAVATITGFGIAAVLVYPLVGSMLDLPSGALIVWTLAGCALLAAAIALAFGAFQGIMPLVGWRPLFWGLAALIVLSIALIAWSVPGWHGTHAPGEPAPDFRPSRPASTTRRCTAWSTSRPRRRTAAPRPPPAPAR